jgi:uncharacterized protein YbbK (DUF523 family)
VNPSESAPRQAILVSACLLGVACTHDGRARASEEVRALADHHLLVPVCPEVAGGLPTPRPTAELGSDGRVRTAAGDDVTAHYERGAAHAVELARSTGAKRAVLKARSPSCGCHEVYDGTHQRRLVEGRGVTAEALARAGLAVVSEEDLRPEP